MIGTYYMINGQHVTAPDQESWAHIVVGEAIDGLQRRSPYRRLEWRRRVADICDAEDWFDFDNTELDSLITRSPGHVNESEVYTTAFCQSVTSTQAHANHVDVIARFLVKVD